MSKVPTGYIFTIGKEEEDTGDILLRKEHCEIVQKIGKIEEIKVVGGKQLRVVVLRAVIGSG